jgi:hypothetical protein
MIWIGAIILFVGLLINFIVSDGHLGIYFGTLLACFGVVIMTASHYETNPSAMDVYQGKTTLEITYKDGVPIDTVVVFKNNKEQ